MFCFPPVHGIIRAFHSVCLGEFLMKKQYAKLLVLGVSLILVAGQTAWAEMEIQGSPINQKPLELLMSGNERFYQNQPLHPHQTHEYLLSLSKQQHPLVA